MAATALLLALLAVAAVTDVWRHKVYNWTTYTGIGAALVLSGLAGVVGRGALSSITLGESVVGFLLCGFVMLVCFVFFRLGGGDVKLIAMIGAFLGPGAGIEAMLWTLVLGGATGIVVLVWKLGLWKLVRRVVQQVLWRVRIGSWGPLSDEERQQLKMPLFLAPNALVAVVIVQFALLDRVW